MKLYKIALVLCVSIILLQAQGRSWIVPEIGSAYEDGYADGQKAAKEYRSGYWFAGSFFSTWIGISAWGIPKYIKSSGFPDYWGECLSYSVAIGCGIGGIILVVAEIRSSDPHIIPIGKPAEYTKGYILGYKNKVQAKKRLATLSGALMGTTFGVLTTGCAAINMTGSGPFHPKCF